MTSIIHWIKEPTEFACGETGSLRWCVCCIAYEVWSGGQGIHQESHLWNSALDHPTKWYIDYYNILAVTCDNASNDSTVVGGLSASVSEAGIDFDPVAQRHRYIAQVLDLGVQDAFKALRSVPDTDDELSDEEPAEIVQQDSREEETRSMDTLLVVVFKRYLTD